MSDTSTSRHYRLYRRGWRVVAALLVGAGVAWAAPKTTTYTYDALGRLTFVTDSQNGNRDYDYDKVGNRLLVAVGGANDSTNEPGVAGPPVPTNPIASLGSFCVWNTWWGPSAGATSYVITDSLGTTYTTSGSPYSYLWTSTCPNGNPYGRKPLYVKACNSSGCSANAQFP